MVPKEESRHLPEEARGMELGTHHDRGALGNQASQQQKLLQ